MHMVVNIFAVMKTYFPANDNFLKFLILFEKNGLRENGVFLEFSAVVLD